MEAIKKTIYICDPEKNTECKKTSCWKKGGLCNCTTKPECAALHENGQPMKAKTEDYQPFKNGGEKNDRF